MVELPCKVDSAYYTIECFCTEDGYFEEPRQVSCSDCEWCTVGEYGGKCDKSRKVVEHRFQNAIQILKNADYIGKFVFLTKEEAENFLIKEEAKKQLS